MGTVFGLSERDAQRLQKLLLWYERFGDISSDGSSIAADPPFRMHPAIALEAKLLSDDEALDVRLYDKDGKEISDEQHGKISAKPWISDIVEGQRLFAFRRSSQWWLVAGGGSADIRKAVLDDNLFPGLSAPITFRERLPGAEHDGDPIYETGETGTVFDGVMGNFDNPILTDTGILVQKLADGRYYLVENGCSLITRGVTPPED